MMKEPFFLDKKILIIDQSPKTTNDRTWCFWEKEAGIFEPIVQHSWQKLDFFSELYAQTLSVAPYQYKMIRGIDLYETVQKESLLHNNIEWRYERIAAIQNKSGKAMVITDADQYTSDYVFNSILFRDIATPAVAESGYYLLQHFTGWVIETKEPAFDPSKATFMDFRVNQDEGTTFMYVMPTSPTTALVEYTLFTEKILPKETYEEAIRQYIDTNLHIREYTITHKEFGIIPMTNQQFPLQDDTIVHMGIAGGQAKGSSGYAFQFIQKRTAQIIASLVTKGTVTLQRTWADKKFHLYDSVLLNVLHNRKMNGDEIFARIFKNNPPQRVLCFLDNESTVWDDLRIMQSVPTGIFLPAALHELLR